MTRWPGRRRRRAAAEAAAAEPVGTVQRPATTHAVEVADVDGVLVLRAGGSALLDSAAVFELARTLRRPPAPGLHQPGGLDGIVTVLVVVDSALAWSRLAELLDSLSETGIRGVRLVMSGAGADHPDRPAVARRIADAWELEVFAPDGTVLLVPGGSLFVPGARQDGGWWRFAPDTEPVPLGPRHPVPSWQSALGRLPARTVGGIAVDLIPAGVLLRPADTAAPAPGDLCYAVPVDPAHPLVLVGVPGAAEGIPADDIRDVLAELPDAAGFGVRLAPGDHRDLLPAGRLAAAALDAEVEVATAPPLLAGHGMRPRLIGTDGEPSWQPFVEAVLCPPPGPKGESVPRLLRWFPPVPGRGSAASGTVRLTDGWQVAVTRAGLWVGAADEPRAALAERPVDPDGVVIEVGTAGRALAPSLLPALSRLLGTLDPDQWPRATLHVHGTLPHRESAELARLAAHHGLQPAGTLRSAAPPPTAPAAAPPRPEPLPFLPGAVPVPSAPMPATARRPLSAQPTLRRPPIPAVPTTPNAPAPPLPPTSTTTGSATPTGAPTPTVPTTPNAPAPPLPPTSTTTGSATPTGAPIPAVPTTPIAPAPPLPPTSTATGSPVTAGAPTQTASAATAPGVPTSVVPTAAETPAAAEGGTTSAGTTAFGTLAGPASAPRPTAVPSSPAPPIPVPATASGPEILAARAPGPVTPAAPAPPAPGVPAGPDRFGATAPPSPAAAEPTVTEPAPPAGSVPTPDALPRAGSTTPAAPPAVETAAAAPPALGPRSARALPAALPTALPPALVVPLHHSTEAEREAFRVLAAPVWEQHSAAVERAMTRIPALGSREARDVRLDLVAVHAYLATGEGPLGFRELAEGLRQGDASLLPYLSCLASGLRRLPSYRGLVLRGGSEQPALASPGLTFREAGPVSAVTPDSAGPAATTTYAIWSATGRRMRTLRNSPAASPDEVVFAPGTCFRELAARPGLVLLRELPDSAGTTTGNLTLDDQDRAVLDRLTTALDRDLRPASPSWPDRCAALLGPA